MVRRKIATAMVIFIMISATFVSIAPLAFAGEDILLEEFTDTNFQDPASSVAGWGDDNVTLSRVDPFEYTTYDTTGWAYEMRVQGDFAYIADANAGLVVVNISDVTAPTAAGVYSPGGSVYSVDVDGDIAIIGEWGRARAVNIANPYSPSFLSTINLATWVRDIEIVGDWAFMAVYTQGLVMVDISNPAAIGPARVYNTPGWVYDVEVVGDMAYVADYDGVRIINVSNPVAITQVSMVNPYGNERSVEVDGDTMYVGSVEWLGGGLNNVNLTSYDISDPSSPVLLDTIIADSNAWYSYDIEIDGDYGYFSMYTDGFVMFDCSDPSELHWLDSSYDTAGTAYGIEKHGTEMYIAASSAGLHILNVSYGVTPTLTDTYDSPGSAWDVFVQGNMAYLADGGNGLRIVDITDPANIASEGAFNSAGTSYGVWASGDFAYLADDNAGLHVMNITDPSSPTVYGTYNSPGNARGVQVRYDRAYLADLSNGLEIVDVSDPTSPSVMGNYNSVGNANDLYVSGDVAYIADGVNGLVSVDVRNDWGPFLRDTYNTAGTAMDVVVTGDFAYVADGSNGLVVLDVTDPSNMALVTTYDTAGSAEGVNFFGNYVTVADDDEGLQIFNVTDPYNPVVLSNLTSLNDAWAVVTAGNYSYVADRGAGLRVVETFANVADTYESVAVALSTTIDTTPHLIVAANLTVNETKPVGTAVWYNLSNDGGSTWTAAPPDNLVFFPDFASTLMWRANLSTTDTTITPTVQNVTVSYYYDDVQPISNATDGAPDYDNEGTIPVTWVATDPFPATGVLMTWLYFRFDSNADGDFIDLGDIAWSFSGLLGQSSNSGTFYFNPEGNDGIYEFYTRAIDNASFFEDAPAVADDKTMFDSVRPASNCYNGAPTFANSGTIPVFYNASDPNPGSGVKNVSLYYRLDANNDGDFTDVGDTEWWDSGLTPQTTPSGKFNFNPNGKDGRYEFFTLANDNATNTEEYPPVRDTFTIFDSRAPVTQHYLGGSLTPSGWYVGSVFVFLSAEDVTSGVNITRYRVDDGQWTVYIQPFMLATDGVHTVEYYSQDMAKNDETPISFEVKIDNDAPETSYSTDPASPGPTGWFTTAVEVTLTVDDPHSGINQTRYRVNRGNWNGYVEPFLLSNDGEMRVEYYSIDHANNREESGEFTVWIDQTDPSVAHTLVGNPAANGVFPSEVTLMLSATDTTSGVSTLEYSVDGGEWTPYSAPVGFSADGNVTVDYRATDVAGNTATGTVTFYIDATPPEVSIGLDGTAMAGWYTSAVTVTVTAVDDESDIDQILVSIDRGVWQVYTAPITVSLSGVHTIDAKAIDAVGHESAVESVGFKIDSTAPKTIESHAGTLGKNNWYITDVQVTLTATDDLSGVANMTYSINGGAWKVYTGPFVLANDGEHKVDYSTTDMAGNKEATKSLSVKVDKTPPTIEFTSHVYGQVVSNAETAIKGKTGADVTLMLNGEAVTVANDGTFSKTVTLTEGPNMFKAVGEDRAGHMAETEIEIVLDTSPPLLNIYSPSVSVKTAEKVVTIQGSTEPGATVTINDEPVTVDVSGVFTVEKELQKGANSFVIKASDDQGNEIEIERNVKRISEVPREQTASEAMPAFILAIILVAVLIAILAFLMGKKMGAARREEMDEIEPEPVRRRRVARPPQRPPPPMDEHGSELSSMQGEGEFGASDSDYER